MARAVMRPLTAREGMQPRWEDGRETGEVVSAFIKPNSRLTSFDRLEIYNRQYWFRLLDCLYDDYPGLRAVLGDARFFDLSVAYLQKYPSTSPTLRDLGDKLVTFLGEEPKWMHPHEALCLDMARLEWAQVVAFDGESRPAAVLKRLAGLSPDRVHLRLQPFITLLDLSYPVAEIVIRILAQTDKLRGEASNAVESTAGRPRQRSRAHRVKPKRSWLLVHRQNNAVYFKDLSEPEYQLLHALDRGASLADAFETLVDLPSAAEVTPEMVQGWFGTWASLGLLVAVSKK